MVKKYTALTLVIIILISVFAGCNLENERNNDGYKTAILGYSDAVGLSGLSVEYEIHGYEEFKDKRGPSKVTYKTPEGKEKTVDLSETTGTFVPNKYYPIYEYGNTMYFNPNGKLEKYTCYGLNMPSEVTCSQEQAINIAKNFVKNIVNVTEYALSVSKSSKQNLYYIDFYKYVDNIKTTEYVSVYVTFDGKIYRYWAGMLDQFTDVIENPFDMAKVKETVYARLDELTKDIKDKYDKIEYNDEEFRLTKLKDGSLAILYTGEILCSIDLGEETMVTGERIEMLIMQ